MRGSVNPHAACDLADDAPVFVTAHGNRPSTERFGRIVSAAAHTAEIIGPDERVTPSCLRPSGVTLLVSAGVPLPLVAKLGRLATSSLLHSYYHRPPNAKALRAAQECRDEMAADAGDDYPEGDG